MALDTLLAQPAHDLGLEGMFGSRGRLEEKRARAGAWATLPAREGERDHFQHSVEWADHLFARLMDALRARALHGTRPNGSNLPDASLIVASSIDPLDPLAPDTVSAGEHCVTSDLTRAFSTAATGFPRSQILRDRNEARFLASAEADGTWFAVSKVVLTACLSQGKNALITHVPEPVVEVLRLTCPGLVTSR